MASETSAVKLKYDFSQFIEVVEFVNGPQTFLTDILQENSALKGILFGQPEYIETIRNSLTANLRQRIEFSKGDIFTSIIPSGYQVYILKDIFSATDHIQAINFLNRCHQATETYSRFLIIETNETDSSDEIAKYHKVKEDYSYILKEAKFALTNVIYSGNNTDIIEILRM